MLHYKIFSDTKERVGCGKQREATALIHPKQNCNPGAWVCGESPAFGQNCSPGSWVCSERPAFGQKIDNDDYNDALEAKLYMLCDRTIYLKHFMFNFIQNRKYRSIKFYVDIKI